MRPVQIPCRFFRQVIDFAYLCRTCIDDIKVLCCLFIYIYDIFVILREPSRSRLLLIDSPPVPLQELAECIHYGLMTTDELTEEVSQVLGHPELG